jgi:hypothetical protein
MIKLKLPKELLPVGPAQNAITNAQALLTNCSQQISMMPKDGVTAIVKHTIKQAQDAVNQINAKRC